MICLNATTDSNDSAISYSSMSLPSSPVRSSAIQQLLESPIIKSSSQKTNSQNGDKNIEFETDSEVNDEEIIVAESPETTPVGSQETNQQFCADLPSEVANSQPTDDPISSTTISESNTKNNCRNSFRRQTSICVPSVSAFNASISSSPRALAILKNAIKSGLNSNRISDKTTNNNIEEVVKNDFITNYGVNSPPNSKLFRNSPLSRGSAFLRAAKERMEKQEIDRSPKTCYNQVLTESNYDRQLTGILRKHELTSSPTSGEPKAKKKKVLFAEPVVSSKLEFKPSPSPTLSCFEPINDLITRPLIDLEVAELTSKQNRILVHQNSEFDKEFDNDSQHSDSPLLFTDESEESELVMPSCGQPTNRFDSQIMDDIIDSQVSTPEIITSYLKEELVPDSGDIPKLEGILDGMSSQNSTEDIFMCSQVMPKDSLDFNESQDDPDSSGSTVVHILDPEEDPIVMVPMRLSQIKDLYQLFGGLIRQYSDS